MKFTRILILALWVMLITACSDDKPETPLLPTPIPKLDVQQSPDHYLFYMCQGRQLQAAYHILTIDGCEYIFTHNNGTVAFCHKGDCKNPIHKIK